MIVAAIPSNSAERKFYKDKNCFIDNQAYSELYCDTELEIILEIATPNQDLFHKFLNDLRRKTANNKDGSPSIFDKNGEVVASRLYKELVSTESHIRNCYDDGDYKLKLIQTYSGIDASAVCLMRLKESTLALSKNQPINHYSAMNKHAYSKEYLVLNFSLNVNRGDIKAGLEDLRNSLNLVIKVSDPQFVTKQLGVSYTKKNLKTSAKKTIMNKSLIDEIKRCSSNGKQLPVLHKISQEQLDPILLAILEVKQKLIALEQCIGEMKVNKSLKHVEIQPYLQECAKARAKLQLSLEGLVYLDMYYNALQEDLQIEASFHEAMAKIGNELF
jgi:hypothetical protein